MDISAFVKWLSGKKKPGCQASVWNVTVWNAMILGILLLTTSNYFLCSESYSQQTLPYQSRDDSGHSVTSMRSVRVGYYPFEGFHMYNKDGKRYGYGYDYLQKLRDYTTWKYEYSDSQYEWPQMLDMLREGKVDLIAGVSKTQERETEFAFSAKPICQVTTMLTVKAGNPRFQKEDYVNWNGIRVGVLKNSTQNESFVKFAKEKQFTFQSVYFDKTSEMVTALQKGEQIDAIVSSSIRAVKGDEWVCALFHVSYMYIVVRKTDQALLNELNSGMEQLESFMPDFQKQLRKRYYTREQSGIIPFSQKEAAFINRVNKEGKAFTVMINPDRKPFSWLENGEYRGILKEYADEISRRTDLHFQYVPVRTREEYYEKRFNSDIDIVFDMLLDYRDAEDNHMKLSQPYFSASVSKLRDKRAGNCIKTVTILEQGDLKEEITDILSSDINVRYCRSISDVVNEVRSRNSDAAYLYTRSAEYAVYQDENNLLVSEYVPSLETQFGIGVTEDLDPVLLSVLNRAVLSLDETFANKIRAQYEPQFKEVFSFRMFVHEYLLWLIVLPFVVLLLICLFLISLLLVRNRHRKELQTSITKWEAASRIAKLHPFKMHIKTRHVDTDVEQYHLFWPIVDGKAVEPQNWVYPEDLPEVEKMLNEFAQGLSDQFHMTYRTVRDGVISHFVCYAVRDTYDPEIMIGIIHDVTKTKRAESQRDDVLQLWEKVVDNSPIMMFIKSETDKFRYVQCNRNFAEFVGRTPEEVIGRSDTELFSHLEDTEHFYECDRQVMSSGQPRKYQQTVENAKGQLRHIQLVKMPLKEGNGRTLLVGMATDVTELQNSRDEARRHEEIFRLTIQSIGDAVLTTDEKGCVQMINPVAEKLIGLRFEDVQGRPHEEVFRIVSALNDQPVVSPLKRALESGNVVELGNHTDLLSFDGNRYHIADCAGPIRNRNNDIIGAVLVFRNVTEEYHQREELRASVALWNVTAEMTKLAPFRMHIPTRTVYGDIKRLNQYWPVVDGKAVLPKDWIYPEDLEQADKEYQKFSLGTNVSFLVTFRAVRNGKTRYYRRYAIRDANDPDMMIGIIQDITIDRELEQERDSSHALWEQVVNAMPILMFVKSADDDFRYIQCNQNFANFIGRKKEDIIGHTDLEFFPGIREKEHFRNWDNKIMEEGKVQEFYEEAQGESKYYHFQTVKMPFTDAKGKHLLIGLAADITAYKKAEEERNAAQKLFNNAFAAMPIILYIKDAEDNFRYVQCNENFCKMFGKTESEIIGRTDDEIFLYKNEVATFHNTDHDVMKRGKPLEIIETLTGPDNKTYHFRAVKMAATDVNGKAILVGMAVDITEMVEQREQMQASQIQLEAGCLMNRSFTFELDENHNISSYNGLFTELYPHADGKPLPVASWVLPEDTDEAEAKIQAFYRKQISEVTINFRTDWFGKRRYYKSILATENGRIFGVTSDITELLEASEEVKATALMWKQVMDELPVRFFVKDVDNECRYLMCNKANADFLGLSEEDILGKTTEEICKPSREITAYLEEEHQILIDHKVKRTRVNIPDPQGIIREMEKIEMPINGVGNRSLLVSIAFDITEREQSLRLAEISARILAGIVNESDFRKVLQHIGETTTNVLNCRRVIFAKCDDQGKLHFFLDTGTDPNYHFDKQTFTVLEYYWNCYLDRLNRNELVCFERMGDDSVLEPLFTDYPEYRNMALVGTPVVVDGKLHGVMIITFSEPHLFTENDTRTLRAISNCIMMAENRSQQNEALLAAQEEQAFQLAERTALNDCLAIFMGSDYMEIPFEQILETIRHHLGASECYVMQIDHETGTMTCLAEAYIEENRKILMGLPPFPFDHNSLWYSELHEKSLVAWSDLSTDNAKARLDDSWSVVLNELQCRSLWVASIETNENNWGTLGIVYNNQSTRPFNLKDESFVRSVARVVSMILTRAQHRNDLMMALETQLNTAECLRYMVGEEDVAQAMQKLLDIIRKHTGADVAFMSELKEDSANSRSWGRLTMDSSCSRYDQKEIHFDPYEEWFLKFKQNKPLFIYDTSVENADDLLGSWAFLLHQIPPVRSYYEFPIHCHDKLWGSVGIMYTHAVTSLSSNHSEFLMNAKKFFEILLNRQENTRQLNEAVQQAQAAEKAKSYFLASMSHEIRTPLNAVIGFTEMLKDAHFTDKTQVEYVENISIASNALLQLINDILDLSKLEAGQMQLLPERIDFPKYCRDICRTFQYSAKQKNLQLIVDIPENMPSLMLDQMRMRQIFFNLVGNSVKFTPEGGTIKVSASFIPLTVTSGALNLTFADTGIGMPEIDQKKIFEPFVQLSKMRGTNASNNGTGLGLPIVRRLIDKMGGTLSVESIENNGTTFYIALPNVEIVEDVRVQESASAFRVTSMDSSETADKAISKSAQSLTPQRVLVVDDVPMNIKIFAVLLKRFALSSDSAGSGPEALEKLKEHHYDWVLTDLYMDGMNGIELARIIRNNPDYSNIRLAIVTADVSAVTSDRELFDAVLSKPIDREILYHTLFGDEP